MIEGYREENLISCGKHFPGHGDTAVDSHLGLPVVDKTLEELMEFELVPFRSAIDHQIPAMMSSHILFPSIEEKKGALHHVPHHHYGHFEEKTGL